MSYAKYTTDAFVLSVGASGEADRVVSLFTKDFGRIRAISKSVRLVRSKLKPHLEEGNFLRISLVRGKEVWRLTDAEKKEELSFPGKEFEVFIKITRLLKNLIQGEDANEILFRTLEECFESLKEGGFSEEELSVLECLTVVKILDSLGYGQAEEEWSSVISTNLSKDLVKENALHKKNLVALINKSLKETHL